MRRARYYVVNQPQLREGLSPSSDDRWIREWVDRTMEQRTDWPWDWERRSEEPAWGDDYQYSE